MENIHSTIRPGCESSLQSTLANFAWRVCHFGVEYHSDVEIQLEECELPVQPIVHSHLASLDHCLEHLCRDDATADPK